MPMFPILPSYKAVFKCLKIATCLIPASSHSLGYSTLFVFLQFLAPSVHGYAVSLMFLHVIEPTIAFRGLQSEILTMPPFLFELSQARQNPILWAADRQDKTLPPISSVFYFHPKGVTKIRAASF